jgi:thiol-disulfide isomerase/thioredoxin
MLIAVAAGLAAGIAAAGFYGIGGGARNQAVAACAATPEKLALLKPLAKGEVAAMVLGETPRPLPDLSFTAADGAQKKLSDFKGRTVVFNIWATWCVPCREEMPALDRLQGSLGGERLEVVAVSIDSGGDDKPRSFYRDNGIANLELYTDPSSQTFRGLKAVGRAVGLPTTLLIDEAGCEIGYLPGPADWGSEDAKALVSAAAAN